MSNVERLTQALAQAFADGDVEMSRPAVEAMIEALAPIAADDFVTVMTGPDESFTGTWTGADGLRQAWTDWLDTFGSIRFELEGIEEVGDNVLTLGRQVNVSRHGGVEIEQPSAAVWKFHQGKLVQVEFHLDRERAHESARDPA